MLVSEPGLAVEALPSRLPEPGELVQVRSRRWLVERVDDAGGRSPVVWLACADDDAQGEELDVFWDYEPDRRILEEEGWDDLASRGLRRSAPLRRLSQHVALELRHRDGSEPVPGAVSGWDQDRRLPDGAAAQGAASPARESLHRRRHRTWQDDRGRADRARAAAAEEGEDDRGRRAAVGARAVEGRARRAVRAGVRDARSPVLRASAPRARVRREPVADAQPFSRSRTTC